MKSLVAVIILISTSAYAVVPDIVSKMNGSYISEGNCSFETATVKTERSGGMDFLAIRTRNEKSGLFKSHTINLDNMWTKVRTTRGLQRIITRDRIRGKSIIAEEKTCFPGWVACSEWTTVAQVTLIDEMTIEANLGEEACTFRKLQP